MGTYRENVDSPIAQIQGPLIGQDLLSTLKAAMIQEPVWQGMFGGAGERIYIDKIPSYNDTILPLIEFWWKRETFNTSDVRQSGALSGRILLPPKLCGDTNRLRLIAATFQRWLGSGQCKILHPNVPGLIEFGVGMEFTYDTLLTLSAIEVPHIPFTLPFLFDVHAFELAYPETDFRAPLTTEPFGWVESYEIKVQDDNGNVRIPTQDLLVTGQTN